MNYAQFILIIFNHVIPSLCFAVKARGIRALRKVSSNPLVFTIDSFVDEELCAALEIPGEASQDARLKFAMLVAGELFAGQWGPNDGLRFNSASSSDANNIVSAQPSCPDGFHVDTNNDSTFRSVTVILYLNDIDAECGGATVFPLAHVAVDDPALLAAKRLLGDEIAHTRGAASSSGISPAHEVDAALLEATVQRHRNVPSRGLRVQPEIGRLCIFFSRKANGEIDPYSWHGGERLLPTEGRHCDKRIMTLFKEVYYGEAHPNVFVTSFEDYLAPQIAKQRKMLEDLAHTHAQYFDMTEDHKD